MNYLISFLFQLLLGFNPQPPHAIYISTIDLSEGTGLGEGKLACRIFQDDLKDAMRLAYGKAEAMSNLYDDMHANLEMYLNDQIQLEVNGGFRKLHVEQVEPINDIYKIDMTFSGPKPWGEVKMDVKLLLELFPGQNNIVSIHSGDKKRQYRLDAKKTSLYWKRQR